MTDLAQPIEMITTFLAVIVLGLAVYRTTVLIVSDHVPFGAIREAITDRWPPPTHDTPGSLIGFLVTCFSCMGVWVTLGWWLAWLRWPIGTLEVAIPFAIAGLARCLRV